jgi:hypothetical protein
MMVALAVALTAGHCRRAAWRGSSGVDPYAIGFISEGRWHLPRFSVRISSSSFPRALRSPITEAGGSHASFWT